ncbi:MAG: hypothetical protein ACRBBO_04070 [Cognatishimia sp.]
MTGVETTLLIVCFLITAVAVIYLTWLVHTRGRDPVDDPKLVERFFETAPFEKLDHILASPKDENGLLLEDDGKD